MGECWIVNQHLVDKQVGHYNSVNGGVFSIPVWQVFSPQVDDAWIPSRKIVGQYPQITVIDECQKTKTREFNHHTARACA